MQLVKVVALDVNEVTCVVMRCFHGWDLVVDFVAVDVGGVDERQRLQQLVVVAVERQLHVVEGYVDIAIFGRVQQRDLVRCLKCCQQKGIDPSQNQLLEGVEEEVLVLEPFVVHKGHSDTFVRGLLQVMGREMEDSQEMGTLDPRVNA